MEDNLQDILNHLFFRHQQKSREPKDLFFRLPVTFEEAVLGAEKDVSFPQERGKREKGERREKKLKITIPPGVESGSKLRLRGQGEGGDAYVEIEVLPSSVFTRVGQDLLLTVPISLEEAVFGAEIKVPTIDGAILLKIPPGVSSDQRLRVKGKGVKLPNGTRGDQINLLKITLPSPMDDELKNILKQWGEKHPYNPRPAEWGQRV